MRTLVAALIAVLTLGTGVALAETPSATSGTTPPAGQPAAKAKPAKTHRMTGDVVSVSQEAKTITVKGTAQGAKEMTFALDKDAKLSLADFKAGERVRVSYVDMDGHLMAKSITAAHQTAKKQ